jgi:hypothetical protein
MAVRTRIDPIDRDIKLIVDELLSPDARRRQFAQAAQEFLDEADETNRRVIGHLPRNTTFVDGRAGASIAQVRADGVIVREYELVFDVLEFIMEQLRVISPIGKGGDGRPGHPGFYRGSHRLFADGAEVSSDGPVPQAAEYVFLSAAPYTRKIEKQWAVYQFTAVKAAARFGNVARVRFGWQSPLLSYVAGGANRIQRAAQRNQPAKQSAKHIERATRVPAIIVSMGR